MANNCEWDIVQHGKIDSHHDAVEIAVSDGLQPKVIDLTKPAAPRDNEGLSSHAVFTSVGA